jgi:hypothetical protein
MATYGAIQALREAGNKADVALLSLMTLAGYTSK